MLTVFVQEVVLDVLAEESLYGLADLLLLLQDVLVILSVVSLGDGWEHRETPSAELKLNFLIVSKLACWVEVQLERHYTGFLHPFFYAFQFKDSSRTFHAQFPEIQGPITFNDPMSIYVYFQLLSRTAPPPIQTFKDFKDLLESILYHLKQIGFPQISHIQLSLLNLLPSSRSVLQINPACFPPTCRPRCKMCKT